MEPPEFVRRLNPDPVLARQAAFTLFVLAHLQQTGVLPSVPDPAGLPEMVGGVLAHNPHLLAFFGDAVRRQTLADLDVVAARDLIGWARAQRLEREEPQVAYELGLLALSIQLPPVLVRSLRDLDVGPHTTVAEAPDGAGYPTVFLGGMRPEWPAAERARLFVQSTDARQLAGWAMLLLSRSLTPPSGSIVVVNDTGPSPVELLDRTEYDVALFYNPAPWIGSWERYPQILRARRHVVV
ncbi:MAG TPA: hypothetical protein VNM48_08855 [Chloroflexota bacterium]|nr:hypothetical protein [Chloroflexota bacterium]